MITQYLTDSSFCRILVGIVYFKTVSYCQRFHLQKEKALRVAFAFGRLKKEDRNHYPCEYICSYFLLDFSITHPLHIQISARLLSADLEDAETRVCNIFSLQIFWKAVWYLTKTTAVLQKLPEGPFLLGNSIYPDFRCSLVSREHARTASQKSVIHTEAKANGRKHYTVCDCYWN